MITQNNSIRKGISILMIITLLFTGFFLSSNISNAATKTEIIPKSEEIYDVAYYDIWKHEDGVWQKGINQGSLVSQHYLITESIVPSGAKITSITAEYNSNIAKVNASFIPFLVLPESISISNVIYQYAVGEQKSGLTATINYDVSTVLTASSGSNGANIKEPWQTENVEGYRYYIPFVFHINYTVEVVTEIGDFAPDLDLPASAKQDEQYSVSDDTEVDSSITIDHAVLEKHFGDGNWQTVASWNGTGGKGVNTGGQVVESCNIVCNITYRITVYDTNGESKSKTKTIRIADGRQVDGTAILKLPEYTYEGHPALAEDLSEFTVDGVGYSARRAYEEGAATNQFIPIPNSSGTAQKDTMTTANVAFKKRGSYNVKLEIKTVDGGTLSDTKPIEVRKTPYIIDNLGGYQKQNRKQILNISVATYPGKPITDYYVELLDMKTGQRITLTEANPQVNNATIKTRTLKSSGDEYWTNFTLEFLTKNKTAQDYRYTVYMKDSKGDTNSVQKVFSVAPDLPPSPSIVIPDTFVRNQGANIAEITVEDGSTTDGDQLQRTWTVSGENVKSLSGYQDQSFGSGQKVKYNKTGVGKETIQLAVKDIWIEPTLEEYVTEADYLSAATSAATEVINIAPVVRLEPKRYITANISILADRTFKTAIEDQMNSIRASLLEKGIDGLLQVVPVDASYSGANAVSMAYTWKVSTSCNCCLKNEIIADSSYAFIVRPTAITVSDYGNTCTAPHIIYALGESENSTNPRVAWSYTVRESNDFEISEDSNEKYILIHCKDINKTIILNRNNGAYLTTIDRVLPKSLFVSEDGQRLYYVDSNGVSKYDAQSNTYSTLFKDPGYIPRIQNGKLTYVANEGNSIGKYYIAQLDMTTETLECISLPILDPIDWGKPVDMDYNGRVVFKATYLRENRYPTAYRYWYTDSKNNTMISGTGGDYTLAASSAGLIKDETGKGIAYYRYQITQSQATNAKYYVSIFITKIKDDGTLEPERSVYYSNTYAISNNIIYARYHTDENAIYLVQGATVGNYDLTAGKSFRISLADWSVSAYSRPTGFDDIEEFSGENGNLVYTAYTGLGTTNENRVKLYRYYISQTQSESKAMWKDSQFKEGVFNYIVQVKDSGQGLSDAIQKLAENFALQGIVASLSNLAIDVADKISSSMEEETPKLHLKGNSSNIGGAAKTLTIPANSSFEYEYEAISNSGAALDLISIQPISTGLAAGEKEYFKEVIDTANFVNSVDNLSIPYYGYAAYSCSPYITAYTTGLGRVSGGNRSQFTGICAGFHDEYETEYSCGFRFTLAKPGYVEFDYYGLSPTSGKGTIDGIEFDRAAINGASGHRLTYLPAGSHTIQLTTKGLGVVGFTRATIGYLYDSDSNLSKISSVNGNTVKGSFQGPKGSGYIKKKLTEVECESDIWQYATVTGSPSVNKGANYFSVSSAYNQKGQVNFRINAPYNKMLFVTFNESVSNADIYHSVSKYGSNMKELGSGSYVIYPGGYYQFSVSNLMVGRLGGGSVSVSNIRMAALTNGTAGLSSSANFLSGDTYKAIPATLNHGQADFVEVKAEGSKVVLSKITNVGKESFLKPMKISFSTANTSETKDQYISNFKLYRKAGYKKLVLSEPFFSERAAKESGWSFSSLGDSICQIETPPKMEKGEEESLVYKKGELVAYNIFYEDYENDPSKKEYWVYVHQPMNDGEHKDAAIICDEDGNVTKVLGKALTGGALTTSETFEMVKNDSSKTLSSSIPRFYVDGKYTVYHWQEDNTNRTGDTSGVTDYTKYDKLSNVESITFYIQGGGIAPWVTSIKTLPAILKEGDQYQLKIGVDDVEKDVLRLTTEVYKEKKLIFTHKATNIAADAAGNYPYITTGYLPLAVGGKYEVVCTVRDWSGAGIGTYKYTVLSDGKITGFVNHTDQWNDNRKKYNLKRFDEEANRPMQFDDYIAMSTPRKRGTNVFWSGEKFMLQSETEGNPTRVKVQIFTFDANGERKSTGYSAELFKTEKKAASGAELWGGSLWDKGMINKWGRKAPEQLLFSFAAYSSGTTKYHDVVIIVDSRQDYWQLHRLW